MSDPYSAFWPPNQARHLTLPKTSLFYNAEVSAARYPDKPYLLFYDTPVSFAQFHDEAERIAGFLQRECGVSKGERVLICMQNCPQFVLAYYGILRAGAVVVPVNPMSVASDVQHYVRDSGARIAFVAQDLYAQVEPMLGAELEQMVVATYSDYLKCRTELPVPEAISAPRLDFSAPRVISWNAMLEQRKEPGPLLLGPDDSAVISYTSGSTGRPKGCLHTHRSVMYNTVAGVDWVGTTQDSVLLSVLPFFHVTGMQGSMNCPLYAGCTTVLLPRWDAEIAARCIERYRVSGVQLISTMVVDLISGAQAKRYDLSSLVRISGGGAPMPEIVAQKLQEMYGIAYIEGYGMSETMAATHFNPLCRPKRQCLGLPLYDVDARIIDPESGRQLPAGEAGEIIVSGPQVMRGYWKNPEATAEAFIELDGKRFLRTGDLGRIDEEGYFFMVDRLKRMINAAGYKVWPAEVESVLCQHPAVKECCVVAARDARRGETVKAWLVLKPEYHGKVHSQDIIAWSRQRMAAYKAPCIIEFTEVLPKTASGKPAWRELQQRESGV